MGDAQPRRVTIRPATHSDSRLVWEWRNEESARRASFETGVIAFEQHDMWFERRLADADTRFFIGEDERGHAFGSVRFDCDHDEAAVSTAIAAERRGKGLGAALIMAACDALFSNSRVSRITALVRKDNPASLKAFARARFALEADVVIKGAQAVRLTLDRPSTS